MWNNIVQLTKVSLISAFSSTGKKRNPTVKIISYIVLFAYMGWAVGILSKQILGALLSVNQEKAFISLICMAVITVTLFTSIMTSLNVLYFSKDNLHLLPLPLRGKEILAAKLNVLLVYSFMEEIMLGFVPMCIYGYMTGQPFTFYLMVLMVMTLLPVLPMIVSAVIIIAIMSFTGGIRNKSLVQLVTAVLGIMISLGISFSSSSVSSEEEAMAALNTANSLAKMYEKVFPSMPFAMRALDNNILGLLGLFLLSVIAYVLFVFLMDRPYGKGMTGSLFSSSGVSDKKLDEKTAYRSVGLNRSYILKEWKVYLRNTTFFVQLILPAILIPPVMIFALYSSMRSQGDEVLIFLKNYFEDPGYRGYVYTVFLLASVFSTMYIYVALLAVSKDGHDAYLMKSFPIPFYKQLLYKASVDMALCFFTCLVSAVLIIVFVKVPVYHFLAALPVFAMFSILHGFLILLDVRDPKLTWTNEIEVSKRNMRMVFSLVFTFTAMAIVAVLGFLFKANIAVMTIMMSALYMILISAAYRYMKRKDLSLADNFE